LYTCRLNFHRASGRAVPAPWRRWDGATGVPHRSIRNRHVSALLDALSGDGPVVAVELRPPRARLSSSAGIDAWIDTYHAVRRLTAQGRYVFLTDSAVGSEEEDNLRHLVINLGEDAPRSRVVPFLTAKHTFEYCLSYADRARQHGFQALVVLGGDRAVGTPRCVEHAWQLRAAIRAREPGLHLGGWVNPHADAARQVDYLLAAENTADFALTQIVSHHDLPSVEALIEEAVCARSIRALSRAGARHFYVSNLPLERAQGTLDRILRLVGE
jgi:hypothetical protein